MCCRLLQTNLRTKVPERIGRRPISAVWRMPVYQIVRMRQHSLHSGMERKAAGTCGEAASMFAEANEKRMENDKI